MSYCENGQKGLVAVATDTYLHHRLLVGNTPSRLLRVVVDGYDRVKVC